MAVFEFRQFSVDDHRCGMKISSDAVLFGAWFFSHIKGKTILDIGTGSGILALMAAQECPEASITAVEIDHDAARAANGNFSASPWASRLRAVCADINDFTPPVRPDIIISNPPYFTSGIKSDNIARAGARHAATLDYAVLTDHAGRWLAPEGHLGLISPAEYEDEIIYRGSLARLTPARICRVRTCKHKEPSRILWDFALTSCKTIRSELIIRDGASYTPEYLALVNPFYLRLN